MRIRRALAILLALCFVLPAHAEEPIAPGKFLGERGQWRFHASAIYSNSESSKASISLRMDAEFSIGLKHKDHATKRA